MDVGESNELFIPRVTSIHILYPSFHESCISLQLNYGLNLKKLLKHGSRAPQSNYPEKYTTMATCCCYFKLNTTPVDKIIQLGSVYEKIRVC